MATLANAHEIAEYRAAIAVPESRAILAVRTEDGYRLPRIFIPSRMRPAQQLRSAIHAVWKLDVLVLEFLDGIVGFPSCVIAQLLAPASGSELTAVPINAMRGRDLAEAEYHQIVSLFLGECCTTPFCRIGWIDEAVAWVETVTGRRISSKSGIEQLNAGGAFTLVKLRTDDSEDYWIKATGKPNAHELSTTFLLSLLCGEFLPELIATKPEWNAWVMSGKGSPLSELPSDPVALSNFLQDAVESMAKLQLRTIGREEDLLAAGAIDHRVDVLMSHSDAMFTYLEECMQLQTSTKAFRLGKDRLEELKGIFDKLCKRLFVLNIPDAVIHGDMNLANIVNGNIHCQFIDWSEAYVGNPFITLQHLLLLNQLADPELKQTIDLDLKDKYRSVMAKMCDPTAIDEAFLYMPLLAAVSTLYGRGDWLMTQRREEPHRRALARTLARYMERSSRNPALQTVLDI